MAGFHNNGIKTAWDDERMHGLTILSSKAYEASDPVSSGETSSASLAEELEESVSVDAVCRTKRNRR